MRIGRCVRVDFGYVGCFSDVVDVLDRHCSGRQECRLRIPDPEMDERRPCLSDLTRYLEASYRCIPGLTVPFITVCMCVIHLNWRKHNEKFGKTNALYENFYNCLRHFQCRLCVYLTVCLCLLAG